MPETPKVQKPEPIDVQSELRKLVKPLQRFVIDHSREISTQLNPSQLEAFYKIEGPLMALASALRT